MANEAIDELSINTIRTLAIDAVQKANSGHPGTPMGAAAMAYTIWSRFLRHNPANSHWPNRDRFVLSPGHASMLLYGLLHLTGYDLTLDDLKQFRQWGSKTPGHPEYGHTHGVELTTGPLGAGFAAGVGMAIAERFLAEHFNRPGHDIVDHYVYGIVSDGDLMEGVASEAASLAGTLGLGKLIYLYDDNDISIEGSTDIAFSEQVDMRFQAYGWHVQHVANGNDVESIAGAIVGARSETRRPSLIIVATTIGFGSPSLHGTAEAHGAPLGEEEIKNTKRALGTPLDLHWPSVRALIAAGILLAAFIVLPWTLRSGSFEADNHFVRTLAVVEERPGHYVEFDRATYRRMGQHGVLESPLLAEPVSVWDIPLEGESVVSIRGRFSTSYSVEVEAYHDHGGRGRDIPTLLALAYVLVVLSVGLIKNSRTYLHKSH